MMPIITSGTSPQSVDYCNEYITAMSTLLCFARIDGPKEETSTGVVQSDQIGLND